MYLVRLEVEEGFLDGLAMDFTPGLNVIIGSRGTGKTSIVELIRYCLDVEAFTSEAQAAARQHAVDVLGSGRVVVTAVVNGTTVSIARTLTDTSPRMSRTANLGGITILSQKEIEQIGKDGPGQLRLIDDFSPQTAPSRRDEQQAIERIRSVTTELHRLTTDLTALKDTLEGFSAARAELVDAQAEAELLLASLEERSKEREELEQLGAASTRLAARQEVLERSLSDWRSWEQRLRTIIISLPALALWPDSDSPDLLSPSRAINSQIAELLGEAMSLSSGLLSDVELLEASNREEQAALGDRSRELRRMLDAVVKGAGSASARVASLKERLGAYEPTRQRLEQLQSRIVEVQKLRHLALDELESMRQVKYENRVEIANELNELLGPRIDVEVVRQGRQEGYSAAVAEVLRGTRLHYNQLAPLLASALSPRELVEAAENRDIATVADIAQLDQDRVARLLEAIRVDGGAAILAAPLEDAVSLRLLDGDDYKDSSKVSTGQRCTVVLPLLLEQRDRSLVIDQPEDHLDNGFIVDTVVKAILSRPTEDQLIVATHNANIPVLGEASRVFVMESDGLNGFVDEFGPLDAPKIVGSITRIMEGGLEAFERRRDFYRGHGLQPS